MRVTFTLMIVLFGLLEVQGQRLSQEIFLQKKKAIDSIIQMSDSSGMLVSGRMKGGDSTASFDIEYFYERSLKDINEIVKIAYHFHTDPVIQKSFYYYQNRLVKVEEGERTYYFIDGLLDAAGDQVVMAVAQNLLFFGERFKAVILQLLLH